MTIANDPIFLELLADVKATSLHYGRAVDEDTVTERIESEYDAAGFRLKTFLVGDEETEHTLPVYEHISRVMEEYTCYDLYGEAISEREAAQREWELIAYADTIRGQPPLPRSEWKQEAARFPPAAFPSELGRGFFGRQAGLDQALIAAIKAYDAATVNGLLNQGASLQARDWGAGSVSRWRKRILLWAMNKAIGKPEHFFEHPTALFVALGQYPYQSLRPKDNPAVLQVLLEHGGNCNQTNRNGETLLQWAITYRLPKMVAMLLRYGADVHHRDGEGRTPLQRAQEIGCSDIVELLQKAETGG